MDDAEEPIPYTHEVVVDEPFRRALVRAIFVSALRPLLWIGVALIAFTAALMALSRSSAPLIVLVGWIVLMGLLLITRYLRVRSALHRAFPVGMVMRSGFGPTQFVITNGNDTSRMAYSGFDRAKRRGELVWVRRANIRRRVVYAGALFSDLDVARLNGTPALSSADSPRPTPGTPA